MTQNKESFNIEWQALTPEQKRKDRFSSFLNAEGIKFINSDAKGLYKIRAQRLVDVYNVEVPDRVPVSIHISSLPLTHYGLNYRTGMADYEKLAEAFDKFNKEFAADLDSFANPVMVPPAYALEMLNYKLYVWPGHGLPDNANGYQFVEKEYMKVNEYDDLILNPADFWMRTYLPRIFGAFESFRNLDPINNIIEMPIGQLMDLSSPSVQETLEKLLKVGKDLQKRASILKSISQQGQELGYPAPISYFSKAPFDIIGDTLRGTQSIMMDMYRCPDKLLEAIDVITRLQIKSVQAHAIATKGMMVSLPLHKGADGWMSEKQFLTFYWPSLKKLIEAFINEGLLVSFFAEGKYDTRLDLVNEFPKGAVHWWFDQTDMARAKRILGNKCCISGNVPSSLMVTGTSDEVKEYSRKLIETCGEGGGYILSEGAADVNPKVENLRAMVEAAKEYGGYRK